MPNIASDALLPLLTPAERDCLHYIIRRTEGFADPAGGRRQRDVITLDQFEYGIVSGPYLLDLGTQLSRGTVKKALEGLQEKGLVEVRYSCARCYWEQQPGAEAPAAPQAGHAPRCPRCNATLTRSWGMVPLTPRKLVEMLNTHDKQKRIWSWDTRVKRLRFENREQAEDERLSEEDLRQEALRLRSLLWYPPLVDEAVKLAELQLKSGRKISLTRRINNFYRPVWEMQEGEGLKLPGGGAPSPSLMKYALEQTVAGPALRNQDTHRWYRYLAAVIENRYQEFEASGPRPGTNAADQQQSSGKAREQAVRDLLDRAADLNSRGEREAARALLSDILSQVPKLLDLFDGDQDLCENSLREAFKQGTTDPFGIPPNLPGALDFYPEWSWPEVAAAD